MILGVDPGLAALGYGIIAESGSRITCLEYGVLKTSTQNTIAQRLLFLHQSIENLLDKYQIQSMAVENLYFARNAKTAFQVGQARGVILLASAKKNISVQEYSPLEIKKALTGYGRADKKQMQEMVKSILNLETIPKPDDAADALAVGICHLQVYRFMKNLGGK